jgi:flagellar basal body-associated protein FliL
MKVYLSAFVVLFGVILGASSAGDARASGAALGEPRHVFLKPVVVSVMRDMRVRGLLSVDVGLELVDPDSRSDVEKLMPRLRDRYIQALTYLASNRIDVSRPLDIDALNTVLQTATNKTLGTDTARVLISGATVRRL